MNLAALSNIGQGVVQGQNNAQQFQMRAQQLQQGQMALDAEKKKLAAQAAVFSGGFDGGAAPAPGGMSLPGPQSPPPPQQSAQPMPPGQPSMPAQQPQGAAPAVSPGPPGPASPQPQQAPQAAPQQPQQGGQPPIDPTDPKAAVMTVMSLAKEIKSRNPGIDPQTLFQAVSQTIDLSKGLAPALRQGAQVVIQQMKNAQSGENTDKHVGAQERGQDMTADNTGRKIASNEKIAGGHDATSLQRVAQQGQDAMARTQASVTAANQRAASGAMSRAQLTAYKERANAAGVKLKAANTRLTALIGAGTKPDDPRVAAATRDITSAVSELDRVNKAAKVDDGTAGGAAPASPAGSSPPSRGPAPAMLKDKPIWPEGGKWVFEDGSEAK